MGSNNNTENMAGVKALVALAFTGSIGLLFLFLACALPQFNNWYPFTVVVFYFLSPIPSLLARRHSDDSASNPCRELAYFLTTGIVLSAFALPIVLARAPVAVVPGPNNTTTTTTTESPNKMDDIVIQDDITTTVISGGACGLLLTANAIMFLTILGFFIAFDGDDVQYSVW